MDKDFIKNPVAAYEELKAENERLKSEIKNNKSAYQVELGAYNMECGNLLEENKELTHYLACMTEQRNKLKTCLQEIKEIAKNQDILRGRQALASRILQIINKAEV